MSSFTGGHLEKLVDAFWNSHALSCPHDGAEIQTHFYSQFAGYLLILVCHRCGTKAQVTQYSDPKRSTFRKWTQKEADSFVLGRQRGNGVNCPVCNASVKYRTIGVQIHVFECLRCGNRHDAVSRDKTFDLPPDSQVISELPELNELRMNNEHASNRKVAQNA